MTNSISPLNIVDPIWDNPSSPTNPPQSTQEPQGESIFKFANRMRLRHQNSKHSHSRPKVISTPGEEAAWQILKAFINPLDCNHYVKMTLPDGTKLDDVYCMNTNEIMNQILKGEPVNHLQHFSKSYFINHCHGDRCYYYRCLANAHFSTGYGNGTKSHLRLPFDASLFGMDHKRLVDPNQGIILLGGDVDCHHNEQDVAKTTNLFLELFPNAYVEPSTNGKGDHLYIKLTYPINKNEDSIQRIEYLHQIVEEVSRIIETERIHRGYDAPFDRLRGLPSQIKRNEQNQLCISKRSDVIKIPFYRDCSMKRVIQFYQSPWYSLQYLENIILARTVGKDDVIDVGIYPNTEENRVNSPLKDMDKVKGLDTGKGDITLSSPISPNRAYPAVRHTSEIMVADLMDIADSQKRRREYGFRLCRYLGRIPTPQELKERYIKSGLFRATSKSDNDDNRYVQLIKFLAKGFNPQKVRFDYLDYTNHKASMEALVASKTTDMRLEWKKDKIKPVKPEKLAAVYWSIRHSQGKKDYTRFSYRHVKIALKATLGQSAHRNEIASMLQILESAGLIVRVADPVWNSTTKLGRGWKALVY